MAATRVRQTRATVAAPLETVDLGRWLRGVTSEEYRSFTPKSGAHESHETVANNPHTFESVETIGGTSMKHRYVAEVLEPHRIRCVSADTRGTSMGRFPVRFRTVWELSALPDGPNTALTGRIEVVFPNRLWLYLSALTGAPIWLSRHNREETPRMAESIAADAQRNG